MAKSCKDCKNDKGKCVGASRAGSHRYCFEQKEVTNGDRIRTMSDEELAKWLLDMMSHKVACFGEGAFPYTPCRNEEHDCVKCGIEWLKQPVKEGTDG